MRSKTNDPGQSYIDRWRASQGKDYDEPPPILYKYQGLQGQRLDQVRRTIEGQEVWFSSPRDFNDVFDGRVRMKFCWTNTQAKKFLDRILKKQGIPRRQRREEVHQSIVLEKRHKEQEHLDGIIESMQNQVSSLAVYCLSESRHDLLMWSYYANGHRGVCLGFHHHKILELGSTALPVTYARDYRVPEIRGGEGEEDMILDFTLTKGQAWSHEREWRVIHFDSEQGARRLPMGSLAEIILGAAISEQNQSRICEWTASLDPQPALFKARPSDSEFALMVEPLE